MASVVSVVVYLDSSDGSGTGRFFVAFFVVYLQPSEVWLLVILPLWIFMMLVQIARNRSISAMCSFAPIWSCVPQGALGWCPGRRH